MTDRSLKAEAEVFLKHTVQTCHGLIRTGTTGLCAASENATKSRFGQMHVDVGVLCWECTGLMRLNTQADTHCRSASRLHTPPRPLPAVCPLNLSHTEGLMTQHQT